MRTLFTFLFISSLFCSVNNWKFSGDYLVYENLKFKT